MPILWLRVALGFYAVGLIYALVALTRRSHLLNKVALPAMTLGMVFQFVSLTEAMLLSGQLTLTSVHNSESFLAFLVMTGFMIVYLTYRTTSPGMRTGWLFAHIALIFTGYAALFLSFGASLLYLVQERSLKSKKAAGMMSRLPALEVIDQIGYRSLLLGFPFMTLGLIAGTVVAQATFGRVDFLDPKVLLSVLMWAVYMIMLYTRWNAGWRGRRAAYLATGAFVAAVVAWAANYFSTIHRFVQS